MKRLPDRPNLDILKKQAKDLLSLYRRGDRSALARFRDALPAAAEKNDQQISSLDLRLHDAQSCLAREYGFPSWADLKSFVVARNAHSPDRTQSILNWLRLIYAGDISGSTNRASPAAALRLLGEYPDIAGGDPHLACAVGDDAAIRDMTERDPIWVNRPGGPLNLPPLVAVTHSSMIRLPGFRDRLLACAKFLLDSGANPNQSVGSRWTPASLSHPAEETPLSALYGAAGQNHDPDMTKLLLDAGADPNDGESLYHSLDRPACTRILLDAGSRVTGSNAMYRVLDLDSLEALEMLLGSGGDPNEPAASRPTADWGTPLLWAIRRRRSAAHIAALLRAGADPLASTPEGTRAHALALQFGLKDVADLLSRAGSRGSLSLAERFIAACALADEAATRQMLSEQPDLISTLSSKQLRQLPELAAEGCSDAVMLMVKLGWPIAVRAGDWEASALNHAVFRGDADLARFLLEHGASWKEQHGFGDNACGSLSWASMNEPAPGGDWLGCARVLVAHGMPVGSRDPAHPDAVVIDGRTKWFSDEVTDFLLDPSAARSARELPS
jgi:ankyrin repeat protein